MLKSTIARLHAMIALSGICAMLCAGQAQATFHTYVINEIYSNADGTVQFVELREAFGFGGQNFFQGNRLTSTVGGAPQFLTFPGNLPSSSTAGTFVLIATQAFANLGIVTPDYIVPSGFLSVAGGSLNYAGVDAIVYPALPTNGSSLNRTGAVQQASPTNFAGKSGAIAQPVSPQTGWWWNPNESGRGFSIETRNGNLFMAGYLYETNGHATWLVSVGPMTDSSHYTGPLLAFTGGQSLTGTFKSNAAAPSPGNVTLSFSDASHGSLTWPGGTIPIERFNIVPNGLTAPPAAFQPQTGWWWNPAESGRGFFVEIQSNTMFLAGYMYEAAGPAVWYISLTPMTNQTTFQGSLSQYGGGQSLTGTYLAPGVVNGNVGAVVIQFTPTSTSTGNLTLPGGIVVPIQRFAF